MNNSPGSNPTSNTPSLASQMLDPRAAGVYLGGEEAPISVPTLADWRTKHAGPAYVRVGRLIRYRLADLNAWLEARTRKND